MCLSQQQYYDDDDKVGRQEKYTDFGWIQAYSYPDWKSQRLWTNFVGNPDVRGWLEIVPSETTETPVWTEVG